MQAIFAIFLEMKLTTVSGVAELAGWRRARFLGLCDFPKGLRKLNRAFLVPTEN